MKICFVAHFAYGALAREESGHIGGVEHQVTMMARWFAEKGHTVSLITWDEGYEDGQVIDGVRLIKLCRRNAGVPMLRFFVPRWSSLIAALSKADADVYYHNCAEYVTGQVAYWCKNNNKQFIYSVASDPDCEPDLPTLESWREKKLYRYGLLNADKVIVQTMAQQKALKVGFGVESVVIGMPCDGVSSEKLSEILLARKSNPFRVIWIGRMDPVKRPEFYLRVAESLPNIQFDLIGGYDQDAEYSNDILQKGKLLNNVKVHGRIAKENIGRFYEEGAVLCCTSTIEGFPNTFLEAWSYGLPIFSTVDPDDLLENQHLGEFFNSEEVMASAIEKLSKDHKSREDYATRCREYYAQNHQLDSIMQSFEKVFND